MVIADQHHAGLMGLAGHPQAITPNFDRFAQRGVYLPNAYCQNPICTPSRVSVLSGQYCHNTGYYGLSGPTPLQLPSMMGHFQSHGYRTAGFGKLHLPHDREHGNWLRRDLDRFGDSYETAEGHLGVSHFLTELEALGLRDKEDSWHNPHRYGPGAISHDAMPSELPYENTQEMWCAREAMRFIDEGKNSGQSSDGDSDGAPPFCIQVAFQRPHHPLLPQQRFWDMYPEDLELPATYDQDPSHRPPHFQRMWERFREKKWDFGEEGEPSREGARRAWRGTLACVTQMDDVFGHILRGLEERGELDNTIVVYHSDHGLYHGIHGIEEKAPGICSDAVCRVPMLWAGPGIDAGRTSDALVENVDIADTMASLCGLPAMDWTDGVDLSPVLRGEAESVKDVAVTENPWSKAMRWGKYRFVHYPREMFGGEDVGELYDIEADPDETRNLYHDPAHAETVIECRRLLFDWLIQTTRVATAQPALRSETVPGARMAVAAYDIAADGKEANTAGPRARCGKGGLN
jgi:arylsulfatase